MAFPDDVIGEDDWADLAVVNAAMMLAKITDRFNALRAILPSIDQRTRPGTETLSVHAAGHDTQIVSWDGPSATSGSAITWNASDGSWTVNAPGRYVWMSTTDWPAAGTTSAPVQGQMFVKVNGTVVQFGREEPTLNPSHRSTHSTTGPLLLNTGDNIKFYLDSPDGVLANVSPLAFSLDGPR